MPSQIRVGDRVLVTYHPGYGCRNPGCTVDPVVGTVVSICPNPLGASFFVRLPCGAESLYTDRMVQAA